jgi:hypothetical protein
MRLLTEFLIGFMLLLFTAAAAQPVPLAVRLGKADVILVGTIESTGRIPDSDPRAKVVPVDPFLGSRQYACEVNLRVEARVKGREDIRRGGSLSFVWHLSSPACLADRWGDGVVLQKPALWLLRQEGSFLGALVDNASTVIPLKSSPPDLDRTLAEWGEPRLALTYLFLKPGVVIPEAEFAKSTLQGELIALCGWRDFLRVYRTVYLESSAPMRGQIALSVAVIGQCLDLAKRTALAEGSLAELAATVDLDGRNDEHQLLRMSWATKDDLLKTFKTPKNALDELTLRACGTAPKTRQRARELLLRYFGIDPATLPCIPCEEK